MHEEINEYITKFYELAEYAKKRDNLFFNKICNFLVKELDFEAVLLFEIKHNSFNLIGKSNNVGEELIKKEFYCSNCELIKSDIQQSLYNNPTCDVKILKGKFTETCYLSSFFPNKKILFKLIQKNYSDKQIIENTLRFTELFINLWFNTQSKYTNFFPELVLNSAQELKISANAIITSLSHILPENKNEKITNQYLSIKKNAQNILLYINDLIELAKCETNSLPINKQSLKLDYLITEITNAFKNSISKDIDFVTDISEDIKQTIESDGQKLKYILTTLLYVATLLIKKGKVFIKVSFNQQNKIEFSISFGKSLDKKYAEIFFNPFVLHKIPELKNTNLTGLSLTLIKKYIYFLGGEINIYNKSEETIFFFTINGEKMSTLEQTISKLPQSQAQNKVLVIEDDYATSKLLSNYLTKWGYIPSVVGTAEEAFEIINSEPLLAVILDIEITSTNGLELLKKIHEHPNTKNVPVIVCSIEPEQQKAFLMGAVEYFVKPINYNYLVEVLTNYKLRKNSKILCVDDDIPTLNLVKQAIESVGFIAIAENVSANVMDLIKDKDIDLAIIDLDMPSPNGFELIKMIKSEKKFANLPIIIYTGKENYKEDLYKIEGLFDELLEKRSTNIEDLADVINAMINRYEVPPPKEEVLSKKGVKKILLAEDYKHSQIIVTRLLKKNNFEDIVVVENGEDAVKMAMQEKFDLILMDMQMPIMNGFEATEKIRQLPEYKDVPIIALTAFAMKGDREKCLEVGATDYIPKPIDSKEFIEKIKYYTNT